MSKGIFRGIIVNCKVPGGIGVNNNGSLIVTNGQEIIDVSSSGEMEAVKFRQFAAQVVIQVELSKKSRQGNFQLINKR